MHFSDFGEKINPTDLFLCNQFWGKMVAILDLAAIFNFEIKKFYAENIESCEISR
jgi:hypothetical protein